MLVLFKQCIEYHLLKENYEFEHADDSVAITNVTQIEKFIFVYDFIKMVGKLSPKGEFYSTEYLGYLNESKRKIQMYLLDVCIH